MRISGIDHYCLPLCHSWSLFLKNCCVLVCNAMYCDKMLPLFLEEVAASIFGHSSNLKKIIGLIKNVGNFQLDYLA
jgi:hypothetical protein